MIRVAIFGKEFDTEVQDQIIDLLQRLNTPAYEVWIYQVFSNYMISQKKLTLPPSIRFFSSPEELKQIHPKLLLSIGGDGTLLQASSFVLGSKIPVLGLNTGRLGFLTSVSLEEIEKLIPKINEKDTYIERRALLQVESSQNVFHEENFALNELTISRRDTSSMISITVQLDDEFLNNYWCDGLIIATSTGSTAYSLSCGGPIVVPNSNVFVITPIAPHNLNIRPMIIPDKSTLKIKVSGRNDSFLVSLDSRSYIIDQSVELVVKKHPRKVGIVRLQEHSYLNTLRGKLNWGLDKRN